MSAITAKASRKMKKYAVLTREPRSFLGSFDFSWEQRKFGEIASKYEDPVPTPHDGYYRLGIRSHAKGTFHSYVAKGQELETAQMHRVAAGNFIVNITFGWEHAVAITDENDAGKLVSHRFPQFSFAEGMVPEFFRYVIVDEKFRHHLWLASPGGAGRNRVLKLDDMLNYLMRFPSRDEQIKIAEFFRQLDHLITLHQRKCANLCSPSQVVFSLLFATSTFSWEQRKLGDVVKEIIRNDPESEAPIMMITANNGFIEQSERYAFNNAGESLKKYILLKKGELAYNHGASKLRPYGSCFALTTAENARIPFVYHCFSAENQNAEFMSIELNGAEIENQLRKIVSSGARMDGLLNISFDEYTSVSVLLPGTEEQDRIADFFRHLDNLITLHQRECISFTGRADRLILTANKKRTTSSWEQRKLGEIGSVSMCRRIFKEQTSETGDIPFYKIGTFGADPDAFISRELFEEYKSKYPYPQKGDILISASGSIGRTVEFAGNNEYFQDSNIVWLNHDERLSNPFLKCFYSVVKWAGIEGSTIKRLYNDNILNTVICMPSVPEQKRIGLFFENLDNLITLHQRKPFLMKWRTSDANRNQTNRLVL